VPPAFQGLPVVGALPELVSKQVDFLIEAHQKHGEIYTLDLGLVKMLVLNSPAYGQHVLRDNVRNYRKFGEFWEIIQELAGNTLPVRDGDSWLSLRRTMQPHFHLQKLSAMTELMVDAIDVELRKWAAPEKQPIDLTKALGAVALEFIIRVLFGTAVPEEELRKLVRAMLYVSGGPGRAHYISRNFLFRSLRKWLPMVPEALKAAQKRHEVDELMHGILQRHRQTMINDPTLFAMLLNLVNEKTGEPLSDQEICDEALSFFAAGFETTATALAWAMHFLLERPDKLAKLRKEVDTVLGQQRPTFGSLNKLTYSRMVFQEAMRLQPPAWFMTRTAIKDDVIGGYPVPAGTVVMVPMYMYHYHPGHWENPQAFDPERFSPERSAGRHPLAWMPFGAGQRLCIGRDLSIAEGQLILAMALQRYDFTPVPGRKVKPRFSVIMGPRGGVLAHVTRRQRG
jgi:cytochrome P450